MHLLELNFHKNIFFWKSCETAFLLTNWWSKKKPPQHKSFNWGVNHTSEYFPEKKGFRHSIWQIDTNHHWFPSAQKKKPKSWTVYYKAKILTLVNCCRGAANVGPIWMTTKLSTTQCGNYGNLLSPFFGKNFVKVTFY